ncbi:MAG TPA: Uma2 family endonuclease [Chitinophagaceae bacterium]
MSSAIKILPHYTYEEYCLWEGRWELIDGIPYAMSPAPTPGHQLVGGNLITEFNNAIKKQKCKHCKVFEFIDVKVSEDTILQPDISIVCKPIIKNFLDFPATLVVEILSPATAFKDRHVKFPLYEKMGIKYFLLINIDKRSIEINMLQNSQYLLTTYAENEAFQFVLEDDCKIEVELNNIWE